MPAKAEEIERLLSTNIRESVAFDAAVGKGAKIKALAGQYLREIMFNPDEKSRTGAIEALQVDVVNHFETVVAPVAVRTGREQAVRVVNAIGGNRPASDVLNDPAARRTILFDATNKVQQRVQIVQRLVNDSGNTLENRLAAYWLEPGRDNGQKLDALQRLHAKHDQELKAYEEKLAKFNAGEGSRPRRPNLDYLSDFTASAMDHTRTQARRVGTDAEHAEFESRGFTSFTWVTVNAGDACPDCRRRQGTTGTMAFFDRIGKPGAGATVCGARCFCLLVPKETIYHAPGLARGVVVGGDPVPPGTTPPKPRQPDPVTPLPPDQAAQIQAAKITPPPAPAAPSKDPKERLRAAIAADSVSEKIHRDVLRIADDTRAQRAQLAESLEFAREALDSAAAAHKAATFRVPKAKQDPQLIKDLNKAWTNAYRDYQQAKQDRASAVFVPNSRARAKMALPADQRWDGIKGQPITSGGNKTKAPASVAARIATAEGFVEATVAKPPEASAAGVKTMPVNYRIAKKNDRAYHYGRRDLNDPAPNEIHISDEESAAVIAHEWGHEVEYRIPGIHDAAVTFRDMRTAGQTPRKFQELFPNAKYKPEEKGMDDDFGKAFGEKGSPKWYVGKVYDWKATEIVSMGIEKLYEDPLKFAEADPEYFRFVIGVLQGRIRI